MSSGNGPSYWNVSFPLFAKALFGGLRYQVSWFVLGLCTVFFFVFAFDSTSFFYFRGGINTAEGEVTEVRRTVFAVGPFMSTKSGRGRPVYRYFFEYDVGGRTYTGSSLAMEGRGETGDDVVVDYPPGSPHVSRIKGMAPEMRIHSTTPLVLLLVIILISLLTVVSMTRKRLSGLRLLKKGTPVKATAVGKKLLSKSRGSEWWEVEFEYKDTEGKDHRIKDRPYVTERIETGDELPVLYDPVFPDKAFLLKNFPLQVEIDETGRVRSAGKQSQLVLTLLPLLATCSVLLALYFEFVA